MKTGITSISIGEKVTIPLKPITLLFGRNSVGKSTVLQAIALARSILDQGTNNPLPIKCSGHNFALGEFKDLVYGYDIDRKIMLELECPVNSSTLPISILDKSDLSLFPKKLKLKLETKLSRFSGRIEIYYDDSLFCTGNYYTEYQG